MVSRVEQIVSHFASADSSKPVQYADLHVPSLETLASVFRAALEPKFESVSVEVSDCPDLTRWGLAAPGICGSTRMLDVGGERFLFDPSKRDHRFFTPEIAKQADLPNGFFYGPGASSKSAMGCNGELMVNEHIGTGACKTTYAKVGYTDDGKDYCDLRIDKSQQVGVLGNIVGCDGKPGKVVHVRARRWKGEAKDGGDNNFIGAFRQELKKHASGDKQIGVGGVFQVRRGQVRAHVMPDFPDYELSPEKCGPWLKFYPMGPDLTCLSYVLTDDPTGGEMGLRLEHTHFFRQDLREGGHYHYNVTPDEIDYEGVFVPCEKVYRIQNCFDGPFKYD